MNVLEKTSQTEAEGWGGFPFHVWGVRVFFAIFFIQESSCRNVQISKNLFFLCFHLIFPAILLILRCNVVWFGVDYKLWIKFKLKTLFVYVLFLNYIFGHLEAVC